MPKTLVDFIKMLAKKGGVNIDDNEEFMTELSAPVFSSNTISENLEKSIDNGLLSVEVAKNNHPDISKHYKAQAYNGLDSRLNTLMDELQIPDDVKAVVLNERSSPERVAILAKKIKELEEKKKATTNDEFRNTAQKTINELNATIAAIKDGEKKIHEDYQKQINEIYTETELDNLLSQYKTVFDDLPPVARRAALKSLVKKQLQDSDAELKLDVNKQLVLLRKDGSNVFSADHRPLNPQLLLDQTLANNKVLKVTDSKPNGQNNNSQQTNGQNQQSIIEGGNGNNGNGQGKKIDHVLSSIIGKSLSDIEQNSKTGIM